MKAIVKIILVLGAFLVTTVYAQETEINIFQASSYQKIINDYKGKPFMLVIWSVSCPSCLSEMALVQKIHQQRPELNIIMLSVDGPEYFSDMLKVSKQKKLEDIGQWGFAEDNSPALRYIIDNQWYGELPRTYFFDKYHNRIGVSGVLDHDAYMKYLAKKS